MVAKPGHVVLQSSLPSRLQEHSQLIGNRAATLSCHSHLSLHNIGVYNQPQWKHVLYHFFFASSVTEFHAMSSYLAAKPSLRFQSHMLYA